MITVTKEKMLIPRGEEFLGYAGDHLHRRRSFLLKIPGETPSIFRIYLRFDDLSHNFFTVEGETTDEGILLNWDISEQHILKSGYVLLQIKAFAGDETEIFHTPAGGFYVGRSVEFDDEFQDKRTVAEFLEFEKTLNSVKKMTAKMPIIGENGNWFIFSPDAGEYLDSEMPSRGERGPTGPQGIQGPKGDKGDKGEKGDPGGTVPVGSESVWLSDLDWDTAEQDFEATKKDKNCVGGDITLRDCNGHIFVCPKGIGTHANGAVRYALTPGEYSAFESYIGVNATGDTIYCNGIKFSLYYQTAAGGSSAYQLYPEINDISFTYTTPAKYIHVDIPSDATYLILSVNAAYDTGAAWANWGMARLVKYSDGTPCSISEQITALKRSKADEQAVEKKLGEKADKSHTHSGADITDGSITAQKTDFFTVVNEEQTVYGITELSSGATFGFLNSDGTIDTSNIMHMVSVPIVVPGNAYILVTRNIRAMLIRDSKNKIKEYIFDEPGLMGIPLDAGDSVQFCFAGADSLAQATISVMETLVISNDLLKATIQKMIDDSIPEFTNGEEVRY